MEYTKKLAEEFKVKLLELTADVPEEEDNVFDVVATTEDVDREGEVIKITSWEKSNWEKNPVVLANHTYNIESIIGKWLQFYEKDGVVRLRGVFSKTNPLWILANKLYNEWMLVAVSVGFIPLLRDANNSKIITKAELLEVSFVAVPCNPNAIRDGKLYEEAKAKGLIIDEVETKAVVIDDEEETLQKCVRRVVRAEHWMNDTDRLLWVRVLSVYPTCIVYNEYSDEHDKYFKRWFDIANGIFTLSSDITEVEATEVWVSKAYVYKNYSIAKEVEEIKVMLKWMADDKANEDEALQKKEALQAVNRATATALEHLKRL